MLKRLWSWLVIWGLCLGNGSSIFAKSIEEEIAELKARISLLEQRLSQQEEGGEQKELFKDWERIKDIFKDISIGAGATFVIQGTSNANGDDLSNEGEDVCDSSYSVDLEFEKEFSDYGKVFVHFEAGWGQGVTDELKVFSNVNGDAGNSDSHLDLTEVWYEYYLKAIPLALTFGKIDATSFIDTNKYANDETTQFLGDIFRNSPTIEFPDDNSLGIRFALEPAEFLDIEIVAMDANADWENVFDNIFFAGQISFKPNFWGRGGNYRFIAWLNDREHTRWDNLTKTKGEGYGFGISFDQEFTDNLGVFLRYAWQNPRVYMDGDNFSLEHSWSVGLQFKGDLWSREEDVLAIAFGQVIPSGDYKDANNLKAESEEHLEVYYSLKINHHLTLSPDVQVIWNPYGCDAKNGDATIVVGGLRAQVDF